MGFEPTYDGFASEEPEPQSESLRDVATREGASEADRDSACFPVLPDDSSRIVTAEHVERTADHAQGRTLADAVEVALARALEGATAAREWALVAQLAGELEARRRARADVPTLADARARREKR
jgi:hypothetical protein